MKVLSVVDEFGRKYDAKYEILSDNVYIYQSGGAGKNKEYNIGLEVFIKDIIFRQGKFINEIVLDSTIAISRIGAAEGLRLIFPGRGPIHSDYDAHALRLEIQRKIEVMARDPNAKSGGGNSQKRIKFNLGKYSDLSDSHVLGTASSSSDESANSRSCRRGSLDDLEIGSEAPDRADSIRSSFIRDDKVREYVYSRACGKCEYCGKVGFEKSNGRRYLETHHIILLSNNGKDTIDNVIGLCPEHHREAHYGKSAESLEKRFMDIIKSANEKYENSANQEDA